jgi:hypothetical protein
MKSKKPPIMPFRDRKLERETCTTKRRLMSITCSGRLRIKEKGRTPRDKGAKGMSLLLFRKIEPKSKKTPRSVKKLPILRFSKESNFP